MCANYDPSKPDELPELSADLFGEAFAPPSFLYGSTFPGAVAPFVANVLPTEWLPGMFGMVPHWGDPAKLSRMTYNVLGALLTVS